MFCFDHLKGTRFGAKNVVISMLLDQCIYYDIPYILIALHKIIIPMTHVRCLTIMMAYAQHQLKDDLCCLLLLFFDPFQR